MPPVLIHAEVLYAAFEMWQLESFVLDFLFFMCEMSRF